MLFIKKNASTTQKSLQDHGDKNTERVGSHPAFAQTPRRRRQNDADESDEHPKKSVTMLRKLLRVRGEVAEPRVKQHIMTIRRRPIGKRHPGFQRRHKRAHPDRKQSHDTSGRRQLSNNGMNSRIGNRHW